MRYERPVAEGLAVGKGLAQDARRMRPLRALTLALGAVVLAVALSLLATWAHQGGHRAAAETAGQTDLAIAIDLNGDSMDECDSIVATGTGSTCTVVSGATFGVKELVRALGAGITDTNGNMIKEFGGMTWTLNYTAAGLTRVNSGMAQVLAAAAPLGGACSVGSHATSESAGATSFTCHGTNPSSSIGAVLRIDFSCNGTGSRTITMKAAPDTSSQTWLHNEGTHAQTVSKDSDETLTINCVTSVGGIAELAGIDSNAAQTPSGSGGGGWSPIEMAALAAGSVVTLAGAGWFVRRRRATRVRA